MGFGESRVARALVEAVDTAEGVFHRAGKPGQPVGLHLADADDGVGLLNACRNFKLLGLFPRREIDGAAGIELRQRNVMSRGDSGDARPVGDIFWVAAPR